MGKKFLLIFLFSFLSQTIYCSVNDDFAQAAKKNDCAKLEELASNKELSVRGIDKAFMVAGEEGHLDVIKFLLKNKNTKCDIFLGINKAFSKAFNQKHFAVCDYLTNHPQARLRFCNYDVNKKLRVSAEEGDLEKLSYLMNNKTFFEERIATQFYEKVRNPETGQMTHVLLKKPKTYKKRLIQTWGINSAFYAAVRNKHEHIFDYLMEHELARELVSCGRKYEGIYGVLQAARMNRDKKMISFVLTDPLTKKFLPAIFAQAVKKVKKKRDIKMIKFFTSNKQTQEIVRLYILDLFKTFNEEKKNKEKNEARNGFVFGCDAYYSTKEMIKDFERLGASNGLVKKLINENKNNYNYTIE